MSFIEDANQLDQLIASLKLQLSTIDAEDSMSFDDLWVNIVFSDGTRLYEPTNFRLYKLDPIHDDAVLPFPGDVKSWDLLVPPGLDLKLKDISELYIRKNGDNAWFVGRVLLYANGIETPLIGSRNVKQFLDNDKNVLRLRDWSTKSICVAQASEPKYPLLASGYRILGPVIGPVSKSTARIIYHMDREGTYRFTAVDHTTHATVYDQTVPLAPNGLFELTNLVARQQYDFNLTFTRAGQQEEVPTAAGSVTTYPQETSAEMFTFAFGSCANPDEQEAQGSWRAIRKLAKTPRPGMSPVRLFVHLGDTFYFYDHMTESPVENVPTMHGAHVSMRRHMDFLDMAREVPCCGIWDDHDFAGNNTDSTDIPPERRRNAASVWRQYWGNEPNLGEDDLGITSLISYGMVDIYLIDGRYLRDYGHGVCFSETMIFKLADIFDRRSGDGEFPRVVVLATGSNWTRNYGGSENYGADKFTDERDTFYKVLSTRMGKQINGLILLSGDNHRNEIFHVKLGNDRIAPEFSASPLTLNSGLSKNESESEDELVWNYPTGGKKGTRGFATLSIDPSTDGRDNWKATVRYFQEAFAAPYAELEYVTSNGQFIPTWM